MDFGYILRSPQAIKLSSHGPKCIKKNIDLIFSFLKQQGNLIKKKRKILEYFC